jgi:serine-type D-Ala-D-Ala carboxypeptidase/endopeptidase (penicillin-binding protein 4)
VDGLPGKLRGDGDLASHGSEPMGELVRLTNKPSDNFFAEMLLKGVGATTGKQGTTERGARVVRRYAAQLGSGVRARDGSGLTAGNKSSPREVVTLLDAVQGEKGVGSALYDSLAIAGKDGTLDGRMEGTAAAGSCRGKTGTISGVSNLSGYCRAGGGLVAFSLLMNGVGDVEAARSIQDRMVVEIARYRGR